MKLHIPEQTAPGADAFPNHPRKVKKWLNELPSANMGEMTRQIYSTLRELNRQTMSNKHRLEIMEMYREPVRRIFDYLKKYFINRTLPLPEKSRKIINLNQALLQEVAYGYKIIIYEAGNNIDKKIDARMLALASCRASRYLAELLLRSSEIYAETPTGVWLDLHQIYHLGVKRDAHKHRAADNEHPAGKATLEDYYIQILLFSLARPTALRQSDTERLYHKLNEWSSLVTISREADEDKVNKFFCADITEDRPPTYLTPVHCDNSENIYSLDTSGLVEHIRKEINDSEARANSITVGEQISLETLKVLSTSWGECPKRRFSRAEKHGHIAAAIGLSHAAEEIRKEGEAPVIPEETTRSKDAGLSLESIPDFGDSSESYITHTELGNNDDNAWDMVAKGKTLTDAYDRERKILEEERLSLHKEDPDLHWEVVNISAGGYCLRWNSDNTSRAQIGEVIALREREPDGSYQWRIGVIRWMQFTRENGLEIGVQVLSPKVIPATINRLNRPSEDPFDALMLPGIRPLKQPPSVLTPSHAFKTGDKLKVNVFEQDMEIKLGDMKEHTGSFTQFEFVNYEEDKRVKKIAKKQEAEKKKDDFDEIWSSL